MKTPSEAPTMQSPAWNQYRRQVIAAITDVEVLMQQRQKGIDTTGLTYEVAELLQLRISNEADFEVLAQLVRATRAIAQEGLRATREDQKGQFSLYLP